MKIAPLRIEELVAPLDLSNRLRSSYSGHMRKFSWL